MTEIMGTSEAKEELGSKVLEYYKSVAKKLKDGFEDDSDKEIFLDNVFDVMAREARELVECRHRSHVVETVLGVAHGKHLLVLWRALNAHLPEVCKNRFASFAVQSLVFTADKFIANAKEEDKEICQELTERTNSLYDQLNSDLENTLQDVAACPLLCAFLQLYARVSVKDSVFTKRKPQKERARFDRKGPVTEEGLEKVRKLARHFVESDQLPVYVTQSTSCRVIETLIHVTKSRDKDLFGEVCQKVTDLFVQQSDLLTHPSAAHVLDQMLTCCNEEHVSAVHELLQPDLAMHATHPVTNFTVQRLMSRIVGAEQFDAVFQVLIDEVEECLAKSCAGVLVNLVQATRLHPDKQPQLLQAILRAFHCAEETRQHAAAPLIALLITYEVYFGLGQTSAEEKKEPEPEIKQEDMTHISHIKKEGEKAPVSQIKEEKNTVSEVKEEDDKAMVSQASKKEDKVARITLENVKHHGSLLLQHLLRFAETRVVTDSILSLPVADILRLARHTSGSYVLENFLMSDTVHGSAKQKLLSLLKGSYVDLACSMKGSFVFEKLWTKAGTKDRLSIASELTAMKAKVQGDRFGKHVWINCKLDRLEQNTSGKWVKINGNSNEGKRKARRSTRKNRKRKNGEGKVSDSPNKKQKTSDIEGNNTQHVVSNSPKKDSQGTNKKKQGGDTSASKHWEQVKRPSKRQRKMAKIREMDNALSKTDSALTQKQNTPKPKPQLF